MANAVKNSTNEPNVKPQGGVMDLLFNIDSLTGGELPIPLLKKIFFIAGLILVYIYYTMMAESKIHRIEKAKMELEEIRADYTTQKADYMKVGKQSYLAIAMKKYKLEVSLTPPIKIMEEKEKEQ
jgi:Tfp pilus assembly protein PilO